MMDDETVPPKRVEESMISVMLLSGSLKLGGGPKDSVSYGDFCDEGVGDFGRGFCCSNLSSFNMRPEQRRPSQIVLSTISSRWARLWPWMVGSGRIFASKL